jgi:hypothetical protein
MMEFDKAIQKPISDWKTLLIGILLSIVPIVSWFAKGFALECSGLGKNKPSAKMPSWQGWGDLFIKGFIAWVITMIYMIPAILVVVIGAGTVLISLIQMYIRDFIP